VALSREAAARSCVLLKNENLLPLQGALTRVALLGPLASDREEMLGTWDGHGSAANVVTLAEGTRARLAAAQVESSMDVRFSNHNARAS
jgi:beta-glucosidase